MTCKQAEMEGGWVMLRVTGEEKEQEPETPRSSPSGPMYQAVQGDEQDVSALKFKHAALLAVPIPTFLCMPSLPDNGRDGTVVWIPAVCHCATTPSSPACCRCQVPSQCHLAADLCVFGQAVQGRKTLHTPLSVYPDTMSPKTRVIQGSAIFGQQLKFLCTKNLTGNFLLLLLTFTAYLYLSCFLWHQKGKWK